MTKNTKYLLGLVAIGGGAFYYANQNGLITRENDPFRSTEAEEKVKELASKMKENTESFERRSQELQNKFADARKQTAKLWGDTKELAEESMRDSVITPLGSPSLDTGNFDSRLDWNAKLLPKEDDPSQMYFPRRWAVKYINSINDAGQYISEKFGGSTKEVPKLEEIKNPTNTKWFSWFRSTKDKVAEEGHNQKEEIKKEVDAHSNNKYLWGWGNSKENSELENQVSEGKNSIKKAGEDGIDAAKSKLADLTKWGSDKKDEGMKKKDESKKKIDDAAKAKLDDLSKWGNEKKDEGIKKKDESKKKFDDAAKAKLDDLSRWGNEKKDEGMKKKDESKKKFDDAAKAKLDDLSKWGNEKKDEGKKKFDDASSKLSEVGDDIHKSSKEKVRLWSSWGSEKANKLDEDIKNNINEVKEQADSAANDLKDRSHGWFSWGDKKN